MSSFHRFLLAAALPSWGLTGCEPAAVCVSTGATADECREDFSRTDCEDWDAGHINGATWSWSTATCDELGFEYLCGAEMYVRTSDLCFL